MVAVKGREGTSSLFTGPCQPENVVTCPALCTADDSLADRNIQNRTASLPACLTSQTKVKWTFSIFLPEVLFSKTCSFYLSQADHKQLEFNRAGSCRCAMPH